MTLKQKLNQTFINGCWQQCQSEYTLTHINPADLKNQGEVSIANELDANAAIEAAAAAQHKFRHSSKTERLDLFKRIIAAYHEHYQELAQAISMEMGAPISLAQTAQAGIGLALLKGYQQSLEDFEFCKHHGSHKVYRQAIGVAVLITPWNWPMNQVVAKVGAALASGCCMVLKPSEYAPFSAVVFAKILQQAAVPNGVFNLIQGDATTATALVKHRKTRVVSITGSTGAGAAVAQLAAPTIKRICQELGGKSAYIILSADNLALAVNDCINRITINSGQSCNAPSRLIVPLELYPQVLTLAKAAMTAKKIGPPNNIDTELGPVVSHKQYHSIQTFIKQALNQGARLICGGLGKPSALLQGHYVKATVLADVTPDMDIFHQEVFGPVLTITTFDSQAQAVELVNNSDYGLSAYIYSEDLIEAQHIALNLDVGMVHINGAAADPTLPFGGWKMSGNGRERGAAGLDEYLETKAIFQP